jgi:hypothetical protein
MCGGCLHTDLLVSQGAGHGGDAMYVEVRGGCDCWLAPANVLATSCSDCVVYAQCFACRVPCTEQKTQWLQRRLLVVALDLDLRSGDGCCCAWGRG